MPRSTDWTRNETLAAFHIYLQLPFGQLHRNQPRIVQLSQWIGRTASAVAMKLVNLASLDPQIRASGRRGMGTGTRLAGRRRRPAPCAGRRRPPTARAA